ncbi:hypothetical protein ACSQ67_025881 [Phaseolus vulgaris]
MNIIPSLPFDEINAGIPCGDENDREEMRETVEMRSGTYEAVCEVTSGNFYASYKPPYTSIVGCLMAERLSGVL